MGSFQATCQVNCARASRHSRIDPELYCVDRAWLALLCRPRCIGRAKVRLHSGQERATVTSLGCSRL